MIKVFIRNISIDTDNDQEFETDNLPKFLFDHFRPVWPSTAKIYIDVVSPESEFEIENAEDVERLGGIKDGTVYVVIYPAGLAIIGIALIAATVGIQVWANKKKKNASSAAKSPPQRESPNNSLSERINSNRLNARIPDIYGEVISTPDLLAQPYRKYENNIQVEYSYMCIGRGSYDISEIRDDKTLASRIDGMSVEIYGPNTSPNSGAVQTQIGAAIAEPLSTAIKSNDVNGQTLKPPGDGGDFTDNYTIDNVQKLYLNFICNDIQDDILLQIVVDQLNEADVVIGTYSVAALLPGDPTKASRGTFIVNPGFTGKAQVRCKRTSEYVGTPEVKDNLQWESMYAISPVSNTHFGNITTAYVRTIANDTSLDVKQRKFNVKAFRKVNAVQPDNTLGALTATKRFFDILVNICVDPYIGNRQLSEIDIDNLRAISNETNTYFGTWNATDFCYTFDDENLSFEEIVNIVTECAFCIMYRRGNLLKLHFEKEVTGSTLLFNHRNKLPSSEIRTVRFGNLNDKDGVALEYVDDQDGSPLYFHLPMDQSAVNPDKVKQLGVSNRLQAYFHAYRLWNRIRYQNAGVEFDATQEALLVLPNQRILVADNTRPNTIDGEIVSQVGDVLTLSQEAVLDPLKTYTIFLQNNNGTIITKAVTQGANTYEVVLDSTTGLLLSLDQDLFARATFEIIEDTSPRKSAFLVEEREPRDNLVTTIRAVNYDDRYYDNDKDYIDGVVDINGALIP